MQLRLQQWQLHRAVCINIIDYKAKAARIFRAAFFTYDDIWFGFVLFKPKDE